MYGRYQKAAQIGHDSDFVGFAIQQFRGQEASTSNGAGPPSFQGL
jgi:hypothetical protein